MINPQQSNRRVTPKEAHVAAVKAALAKKRSELTRLENTELMYRARTQGTSERSAWERVTRKITRANKRIAELEVELLEAESGSQPTAGGTPVES